MTEEDIKTAISPIHTIVFAVIHTIKNISFIFRKKWEKYGKRKLVLENKIEMIIN